MISRKFFVFSAWVSGCILILLVILVASLPRSARSSPAQERSSEVELGLDIAQPDKLLPKLPLDRLPLGHSSSLILRRHLKIIDPDAAGDFTAVGVGVDNDGSAVRIRLSIIYNDLSKQEWWKDKKEKIADSYLIHEGEVIRSAELVQFGIEPFEMKLISMKPVVLEPGEGPQIINKTSALEVNRLEKHIDSYHLWLKNKSDKNIVTWSISTGNSTVTTTYGGMALAAGATSSEEQIHNSDVEKDGITISFAFFEDGSFEGDAKLAAQYVVRREGIRIQAPKVLRMVEQTLKVEDARLPEAFEKLEADLWVIPEAIDKQSALELLKSEFASFDKKTLSDLYEHLKGGLYEARNMALSPIGDAKRGIQADEEHNAKSNLEFKTSSIRRTLTRIKENFEKLVGSQR